MHISARMMWRSVVRSLYDSTSLRLRGNTSSEEQVNQRIDKKLKLPASLEYLGKEVDSVVEACNRITKRPERTLGLYT